MQVVHRSLNRSFFLIKKWPIHSTIESAIVGLKSSIFIPYKTKNKSSYFLCFTAACMYLEGEHTGRKWLSVDSTDTFLYENIFDSKWQKMTIFENLQFATLVVPKPSFFLKLCDFCRFWAILMGKP